MRRSLSVAIHGRFHGFLECEMSIHDQSDLILVETYLADTRLSDGRGHCGSNGGHRVVFVFSLPALGFAGRLDSTGFHSYRTVAGFLIQPSLWWFGRIGLRWVDRPTERLNRSKP